MAPGDCDIISLKVPACSLGAEPGCCIFACFDSVRFEGIRYIDSCVRDTLLEGLDQHRRFISTGKGVLRACTKKAQATDLAV